MADGRKDKAQNAEQEGTEGTEEPKQSTAEFYSMEDAPTLEDFTPDRNQRDQRQDLEAEQADAHDGGDSGFQRSPETEAPGASEAGASLLNPLNPQAGRLGERLDDAALRPDHTSPNVFDDAADTKSTGGYGGMGKEDLISDATGGVGYGAGYDSEEGLQNTGAKPSGDNWLYDLAEGFSSAFVPVKTDHGPTNQEFRRLEQEEIPVAAAPMPRGAAEMPAAAPGVVPGARVRNRTRAPTPMAR